MNFKISDITVSQKTDPLIIAEIGINHNGSLERAINIADQAMKSGAKVIKHQTHIVDDEYSFHAKKIKPGNSNRNIFDIIKNCSLNEEEEFKLMNYIKKKKRIFISTPFSLKAVDRLIKFKVPAFKVGSGECNNHILIDYIAKQNKPIILSTGMNNMSSVDQSVKIINKYGVNISNDISSIILCLKNIDNIIKSNLSLNGGNILTDGSYDFVKNYSSKIPIILSKIEKSKFSFGRSLNMAANESTYKDILISLSAHCFPTNENWLYSMITNFENEKIKIVYGKQLGDTRSWLSEASHLNMWFGDESSYKDSSLFFSTIFPSLEL